MEWRRKKEKEKGFKYRGRERFREEERVVGRGGRGNGRGGTWALWARIGIENFFNLVSLNLTFQLISVNNFF